MHEHPEPPSAPLAAETCLVKPEFAFDGSPMLILAGALVAILTVVPLLLFLARWIDGHMSDAGRHSYIRALRVRHSVRARLRVFLFVHTKLGLAWEIMQSLLSLASLVVYITSTYYINQYFLGSCYVDDVVELFFVSSFSVDLVWNFYLAEDKMAHFFSFMVLADVLTITASLISFVTSTSVSASIMYVRVLRLMRIIRVLRALRLFHISSDNLIGGLRHLVITMSSTIAVIWLVSACLLQYIEWIPDHEADELAPMMPWHEASYFMLIEVLGRPKIPIDTPAGYCVLMIVVVLVFFMLPPQLAAIAEAIRRDSSYRRQFYSPRNASEEHVVVSGHITFSSLHDFLFDFFHEDHHTHRTRVVVLADDEPPVEIRILLSHPQLSQWVKYLQGSLENASDLDRARVDCALGVFLFADKELATHEEQQRQDLRTISSVLALKSHNAKLQLFVQLLLQDNKAFLSSMPDWVEHDDAARAAKAAAGEHTVRADQLVCVNEFAASMLAISAISPGLSTVITNLYSSHHIPSKVDKPWLREYCRGFSNEVYMCSLAPGFAGWTFLEVACHLYLEFGAILVSLESMDEGVVIQPPGEEGEPYVLRDGDIGHVIALDAFVAMSITCAALEPALERPELEPELAAAAGLQVSARHGSVTAIADPAAGSPVWGFLGRTVSHMVTQIATPRGAGSISSPVPADLVAVPPGGVAEEAGEGGGSSRRASKLTNTRSSQGDDDTPRRWSRSSVGRSSCAGGRNSCPSPAERASHAAAGCRDSCERKSITRQEYKDRLFVERQIAKAGMVNLHQTARQETPHVRSPKARARAERALAKHKGPLARLSFKAKEPPELRHVGSLTSEEDFAMMRKKGKRMTEAMERATAANIHAACGTGRPRRLESIHLHVARGGAPIELLPPSPSGPAGRPVRAATVGTA